MKIMLCTDGSQTVLKAAKLLVTMQLVEQAQFTLLGVHEEKTSSDSITTSFDQIEETLGGRQPGWQRIVKQGSFVKIIETQARADSYDLVALGENKRHHRGLWLLKSPSPGERLANRLEMPLLVARDVPGEMRKVLFCSSAKDPSELTLRLGSKLIAPTGANVGVLHVMSQLALVYTPAEADLRDTAETAIQRQSPEGMHLLHAIEVLHMNGVKSAIIPRMRHGLVLDEIVAEIRQGGYDLLVIGAHHRPGYDPMLEKLAEDVATDLISAVPCSVMVI